MYYYQMHCLYVIMTTGKERKKALKNEKEKRSAVVANAKFFVFCFVLNKGPIT